MKLLAALAISALCLLALGAVSRRLATHQTVLPAVRRRVNTRVVRINQR